MSCTDLDDLPKIYGYMDLCVSSSILFFMMIMFCRLLHSMKKYGNYEFRRLWKKLLIYFPIMFLSYGVDMILSALIRLAESYYEMVVSVVFITNTHVILLSGCILFLKDNRDDMIQELSRLDNQVIISRFQRLKIEDCSQ